MGYLVPARSKEGRLLQFTLATIRKQKNNHQQQQQKQQTICLVSKSIRYETIYLICAREFLSVFDKFYPWVNRMPFFICMHLNDRAFLAHFCPLFRTPATAPTFESLHFEWRLMWIHLIFMRSL